MRVVTLSLLLATACSRIAGIGGEFRVEGDDPDGGGSDSGGPGDGGIDAYVPVQAAYLKASNPDNSDEFGTTIAVSADGNTLAVGAPLEDSALNGINQAQNDNNGADAGAVYVFVRTAGVWSQQAYIKAGNSDPGDRFGFGLALSDDGNTMIIGAPSEDTADTGVGAASDNLGSNSGAAYVFTRSGTVWTQSRFIKASNAEDGDNFGFWVAISGDGTTFFAGAPNEDSSAVTINGSQTSNGTLDAGAVYVFARGADWTQQAYLKPGNLQAGHFGQSGAISQDGNTIAIGAPFEASPTRGINGSGTATTAADSGAAYVFTRAGTVWSQQAYIKSSNSDAADNFGWTVGLSANGNILAIGAPNEKSRGVGIGNLPADNSGSSNGAAYLFERVGTTWTERAYLKASNTDDGDQFAVRLAVSRDGAEILVASIQEDSVATGIDGNQSDNTATASGAAYLFVRSPTLMQQHYIKASNAEAGDRFGFLPASSTRVIGGQHEDSASAGIGGDQTNNVATDSGAVYVFE